MLNVSFGNFSELLFRKIEVPAGRPATLPMK